MLQLVVGELAMVEDGGSTHFPLGFCVAGSKFPFPGERRRSVVRKWSRDIYGISF